MTVFLTSTASKSQTPFRPYGQKGVFTQLPVWSTLFKRRHDVADAGQVGFVAVLGFEAGGEDLNGGEAAGRVGIAGGLQLGSGQDAKHVVGPGIEAGGRGRAHRGVLSEPQARPIGSKPLAYSIFLAGVQVSDVGARLAPARDGPESFKAVSQLINRIKNHQSAYLQIFNLSFLIFNSTVRCIPTPKPLWNDTSPGGRNRQG